MFIMFISVGGFFILHVVDGSVLQKGIKAPLTINQMLTPYGVKYMKSSYFQLIFPGTKWCGHGDVAEDPDDLGRFSETDMCCRSHDYCEDILYNGEMKENLINTHKFTRLHCSCDLQFYVCLKHVKKDPISSQIIGISYFEALAPKCFSYQPPATCIKHESTLGFLKRCVQYKYDCTMKHQWQWFDVPKWI